LGFHKKAHFLLVDLDNKRKGKEENESILTEKVTEEMIEYDKILQEILKFLVFELKDPLIVEHSDTLYSKGYHLWFVFKDNIPESVVSRLKENIVTKFGVIIELYSNFSTGRGFRLPYSFNYRQNCGVYDPSSSTLIKNLSFFEILERVQIEKKSWMNENTFKYSDFANTKKLISANLVKKSSKKENVENPKVTAGHRNEACYKIAMKYNFKIYEDYEACIMENYDGTSKDVIKHGQEWFKKELLNIYNWSIKVKKKTHNNDYERKENYEIFDYLSSSLDKKEDLFYRNLFKNLFPNKGKGKNKEKNVDNLIKVLAICKSNFEYFSKNPLKYKIKKFKSLEKGMPFSIEFKKAVNSKFKIQNFNKYLKILLKGNYISLLYIKSINPKTKKVKLISYCPNSAILNNKYAIAFCKHYTYNDIYIYTCNLIFNFIYKLKIKLVNAYLILNINICEQVFSKNLGICNFSP
jgi:hypothetical protein